MGKANVPEHPRVPERPSVFTLVGAALVFIGGLVCTATLFLTWGKSADANDTRNFSFTLWNVAYMIKTKSWEQSWDEICPRSTVDGFCLKIRACRAFAILGPLIALGSVLISLMGYKGAELTPVQIGNGLGVISLIVSLVAVPLGYKFIGDVQEEVTPISSLITIVADKGPVALIAGALIIFLGTIFLSIGFRNYNRFWLGQQVMQPGGNAQMPMNLPPQSGQHPPQGPHGEQWSQAPLGAQGQAAQKAGAQTYGQAQSPWANQQVAPTAAQPMPAPGGGLGQQQQQKAGQSPQGYAQQQQQQQQQQLAGQSPQGYPQQQQQQQQHAGQSAPGYGQQQQHVAKHPGGLQQEQVEPGHLQQGHGQQQQQQQPYMAQRQQQQQHAAVPATPGQSPQGYRQQQPQSHGQPQPQPHQNLAQPPQSGAWGQQPQSQQPWQPQSGAWDQQPQSQQPWQPQSGAWDQQPQLPQYGQSQGEPQGVWGKPPQSGASGAAPPQSGAYGAQPPSGAHAAPSQNGAYAAPASPQNGAYATPATPQNGAYATPATLQNGAYAAPPQSGAYAAPATPQNGAGGYGGWGQAARAPTEWGYAPISVGGGRGGNLPTE